MWIAALRNIARMANQLPIWNFSPAQFISHSMGCNGLAMDLKFSVTKSVSIRNPEPASIRFMNLIPKSFHGGSYPTAS